MKNERKKGDTDLRLLSLGVQYFVLARQAVFLGFSPPCGNLYHLAFEVLIKSVLAKKHDREKLKGFSHNLPRLWREFRKIYDDRAFDRFDSTIKNLHKYEPLRYLDFPKGGYWAMSMTIDFGEGLKPKADILKKNRQVHFSFNFDEMDELFKVIIIKASINPPFLKTYFGLREGLKIYKKDNRHSLY